MNVTYLCDAILPPLTGIGRYAYEIAAGLQSNPEIGQVEYVSYRGIESWQVLQSNCQTVNTTPFTAKKKRLQIDPVRMRGWLIDRPVVSYVYGEVQQWQYARAMSKRAGWIVHGPNYLLPRKIMRGNVGVVTVHDLSTELFPDWHPEQRVQRMRHVLRDSIPRADLIVVDAEATVDAIVERFNVSRARILSIPLGVDAGWFSAPLDLRRKHTLCVSTIEPRKNIDALLTAYQAIPATLRREFPLLLAGSYGWKSDETHARIAIGQREGWLHYLGYVSDVELLSLYSQAQLVVYPSLHEGFGLPVLEAMAAGCRVIAGNHSSIPEVASGLACLVDVREPDEIAEAIKTNLEQAWTNTEAAPRRAHASRFTWTSTVNKTLDAYRLAEAQHNN